MKLDGWDVVNMEMNTVGFCKKHPLLSKLCLDPALTFPLVNPNY